MMAKFTPGPWCTGEPFETFPGAGLRFHISQAEGAPYTPHYSDVAQFVAETISSEKLAIQQANACLIAAAPSLFAEIEREYIELADYTNNWPGRDTMKGQSKLARLRDLISAATGKTPQEVQDDYGTRAAKARGSQ